MPQTRIADDVWLLAQEVSDRMGLNSPRMAIEAIVRVCASHYTIGSLPAQPLTQLPVKAVTLTEPTAIDAASELSSLMQSCT